MNSVSIFMSFSEQITSLTGQAEEFIISSRRFLHQIPELAFEEFKSAAFVADTLLKLGFEPRCNIAGTGITADLHFPKPGPRLLIRADMDALPVQEATGLPFASTHNGRMHACGHDGHTAMLLGTARALKELSLIEAGAALGGSVRFLFQPAEEAIGGAGPMVQAGVLEGVHACLAAHIWPPIPEGAIGVRRGPLMAATDRFEITLTGTGGHGAQPHLCTDALDAAVQLAGALQRVVGRRINPLLPAVLTVACIQAGDTYNVIPQTALLKGSARAFQSEVRDVWEKHIVQITRGISESMGVAYDVNYMPGHGPVCNDADVTALVGKAAARVLSPAHVVEPDMTLTGEDFSVYQETVPGCMFFVGAGKDGGKPLHHPGFTFDESILLTGVRVFCEAALELLTTHQNSTVSSII